MSVDIGDIEAIQIPEPFGLSHSGGSGFRIGTVYECPRKAALTLLGWTTKRTAFYFAFGTLIHRHAFRPYLGDGDVDPKAARAETQDMVDTEKAVSATYVGIDGKEHTETQDIAVKASDRAEAPVVASNMMTVWSEGRYPDVDVTACEERVRSPVRDPDTGGEPEEFQAFRVLGRLDMVLRRGDVWAVRDFKTARSKLKAEWFSNLDYHRQLSLYRYAWASVRGEIVNDVGAYQMTKHKTLKAVRENSGEVILAKPLRFRTIYDEVTGAIRRLRECERTGVWPCNPFSCAGKFGEPCPFMPLCWADQYDDPNEWKKTLRRRGEP